MNVADLILRLQQCQPDREVVFCLRSGTGEVVAKEVEKDRLDDGEREHAVWKRIEINCTHLIEGEPQIKTARPYKGTCKVAIVL